MTKNQWIRDCARDLLVATHSTEAANRPTFVMKGAPEMEYQSPVKWAWAMAEELWELHRKADLK